MLPDPPRLVFLLLCGQAIYIMYGLLCCVKKNIIRCNVTSCCVCGCRGGSRIFFRRGCTRLLLYFNTNKPHSFFLENTSCIRKPQVISGGGGRGAHPLHPPPRSAPGLLKWHFTANFTKNCFNLFSII